jgi:hypothetical protein
MKSQVQTWCQSCASENQEHKIRKAHGKAKKQPPWWDSETEKTWTEKRAAVKKMAERENSTKPRPNAQNNNGRQNRAVQKGSTGSKRS